VAPCSLDGTTAQKIQVMLVIILVLLSLFFISFFYVLGGINHRITFIHQSLCHFVVRRTVNCMIVVQYKNKKCLSMWIPFLFECLPGKE